MKFADCRTQLLDPSQCSGKLKLCQQGPARLRAEGVRLNRMFLRLLSRPAWIRLEPIVSAGPDAPRGTLLSCALLRLAKKLLELLTFRGTRWNLSCTVQRYAARKDPFLSVSLQELGVQLIASRPASSNSVSFLSARQDVVATGCSHAPLLSAKPASLYARAKFLAPSCRL